MNSSPSKALHHTDQHLFLKDPVYSRSLKKYLPMVPADWGNMCFHIILISLIIHVQNSHRNKIKWNYSPNSFIDFTQWMHACELANGRKELPFPLFGPVFIYTSSKVSTSRCWVWFESPRWRAFQITHPQRKPTITWVFSGRNKNLSELEI